MKRLIPDIAAMSRAFGRVSLRRVFAPSQPTAERICAKLILRAQQL